MIPFLETFSTSYGSIVNLKFNDVTKVKIGTLQISNAAPSGYTDNSYFAIYDLNDSATVYKKTKGTTLSDIEIDVSNCSGILIRLSTSRSSTDDTRMFVTVNGLLIT